MILIKTLNLTLMFKNPTRNNNLFKTAITKKNLKNPITLINISDNFLYFRGKLAIKFWALEEYYSIVKEWHVPVLEDFSGQVNDTLRILVFKYWLRSGPVHHLNIHVIWSSIIFHLAPIKGEKGL